MVELLRTVHHAGKVTFVPDYISSIVNQRFTSFPEVFGALLQSALVCGHGIVERSIQFELLTD